MHVPLALDPATITGWALWKEPLTKPRASSIEMPDVDRDLGWWGAEFLDWLVPFARLEGVTEIITEAPIIVKHKHKGAEKCPQCGQTKSDINYHEVEKLVSLSAFAALGARQLGVPFALIQRGTVLKHFIGVGPRDPNYRRPYLKAAVIAVCQRKGWAVETAKHPEDVADACATLDWYVDSKRIKVPWNCQPAPGPLFDQQGVRIDKTHQVAGSRLINRALSFDRAREGVS